MVLDEPTNDLDLETLDLLQEMLAAYPGTLILVSHDRDFLDRTVTSVIAFEGEGSGSNMPAAIPTWWRNARLAWTRAPPIKRSAPRPAQPVARPSRRGAEARKRLSPTEQTCP